MRAQVHSCADAGNQALLLVGLRLAAKGASKEHPYGHGKSVYLWSLVSALGTFWLGAGVALHSSVTELLSAAPAADLARLGGWEAWGVLGVSLGVDGAVLYRSAEQRSLFWSLGLLWSSRGRDDASGPTPPK